MTQVFQERRPKIAESAVILAMEQSLDVVKFREHLPAHSSTSRV